MNTVIVIGTGTMGVGIAAGFLASGANIVILGRSTEKAMACLGSIQVCAQSINPNWSELNPQLLSGSIDEWQDWEQGDRRLIRGPGSRECGRRHRNGFH